MSGRVVAVYWEASTKIGLLVGLPPFGVTTPSPVGRVCPWAESGLPKPRTREVEMSKAVRHRRRRLGEHRKRANSMDRLMFRQLCTSNDIGILLMVLKIRCSPGRLQKSDLPGRES
jgi:hypothetical protein